MTPAWVDLPGLFPLDRNHSGNSSNNNALRGGRTGDEGNRQDSALLLRGHQADLLLLALVLLFLAGSYLVCRCCRCRWLHRRRARDLSKTPGTRSYAYTLYQSNSSGSSGPRVVMESVTAPLTSVTEGRLRPTPKKPVKAKAVLVSEMEEPFLGPPDYAQPPPFEMSPPAYDYLPSAPPLSDDANHSPRQV